MKEVVFLSSEDVISIHQDQIARYGGDHALRDPGLLESAVAQPQASFGGNYLHNDLFAMASAYLFHLVQNHPFVDGNKRTGAVACLAFLALNGVRFEGDEDGFEAYILAVARGEKTKEDIAEFLRLHAATTRAGD